MRHGDSLVSLICVRSDLRGQIESHGISELMDICHFPLLSSKLCSCLTVEILLQEKHARWQDLYIERWGSSPLNPLTELAQQLAGGWKALCLSKIQAGDTQPSHWEVKAALNRLTNNCCNQDTEGPAAGTTGTPLNKAFFVLLDSSGSVEKGAAFMKPRSVCSQSSLRGRLFTKRTIQYTFSLPVSMTATAARNAYSIAFCAEEFDYMKSFAVLLAADLRGDPNAKVSLFLL